MKKMDHLSRYASTVLFLGISTFLTACSGNPPSSPTSQPATQPAAPASQPASPPTAAAPATFEGYHDVTNCNGIMGWAWDRSRPDEAIKIDIYDGNTLLATVTAGDFRDDLQKAGKGNGKHGFNYAVPPRLKDEKPHSIRMKFAGTTTDLNATPKDINCALQQ